MSDGVFLFLELMAAGALVIVPLAIAAGYVVATVVNRGG